MIELNLGDGILGLSKLGNNSVNCILTDPPYLYLKNQKLDKEFDEKVLFSECKRILKDDGFIVLFGRGSSFYRWNTILADLGFVFKEEIIWDKQHTSSPIMKINRVHETICILSKKDTPINPVKIPYEEMKGYDLSKMIDDINRIKTAFNNSSHFDKIQQYLNTQKRCDYHEERKASKHNVTLGTKRIGNRVLNPVQAICEGMKEKSIIRLQRDHYTSIHPTQKPVRLLERLLQLVTKEGDLVIDPFAGSFSCAEACNNINRNFIGWEIDNEYYSAGRDRIDKFLQIKN